MSLHGESSATSLTKPVRPILESEGKIDAARHAEYDGRTTVEELAWRLRLAFFRDAREIGRLDVQRDVAAETGLAVDEIRVPLEDGRAFAALAADGSGVLIATHDPRVLENCDRVIHIRDGAISTGE